MAFYPAANSKRSLIFWLCGAVILTSLLYWPGLSGPFFLDDISNLAPTVPRDLSLTETLRILGGNTSGPTGRPVSVFSFMLTGYAFGFSPFAFKAVNLLIHLLNGLLIGLLTAKLLQADGTQPPRAIRTISVLTATLWLIHPMQLSTVLYPVQRMTELAGLFSLLALICYLAIRRRLNQDRPLPVFGTLALALCVLLAIFSKENAALLPVFILLIEIYFLKLKTAAPTQRAYLFAVLLVFCLLPIAAGGYYLATHIHSTFSTRNFDLYERLLTETHVLVFYLRNIVMPNLSEMSLFLDGFPITRHIDPSTLLCSSILVALLTIAALSYEKAPVLSFGLLFYFSGQLMESTVIPLELAFEHRNYLPLYGLVLPVAYYLVNSRFLVAPQLKMLTAALIIVVLSVTTWLRSEQWSDATGFYAASVIDQPDSMRASIGMANVLLAQNRLPQARYFLGRAARLAPQTAAPVIHRLVTYCATNERDLVNALREQAAERIEHGLIDGYTVDIINRLQLLKRDRQCPGVSGAQLVRLTGSLFDNRRASDPQGKYSLMHARSLNLAGQPAKALPYYRKAISRLPERDIPDVLVELGTAAIELGELEAVTEIAEQLKQRHNPPFYDTARQSQQLQSLIEQNRKNGNTTARNNDNAN